MGIYLNSVDLYPAVVSWEGDRFVARFIDIPDCQASGRSLAEAEDNAGHALAGREASGGGPPFASLQRQQRTGR